MNLREKHKLAQFSSIESNLDSGAIVTQGQKMKRVIVATYSRERCSPSKHPKIFMQWSPHVFMSSKCGNRLIHYLSS